jgi:hypothetical protein
MTVQLNRVSINPSKIGEHPETNRTIPSQPVNAGGVETVVASRAEFKGIIAGMMLGDGHIDNRKESKNSRLKIQHGIKQEGYLLYKAALLEQLTAVNIYRLPPRGKKNPNWNVVCQTRVHPLYTRARKIIYHNGIKSVTPTWLNWLDERGLAIWYMDDGSLMKRRTRNKSGRLRIYARTIRLNTCGFTLEENQLLQKYLKEKFDLSFRLICMSKKYWALGAGAAIANKLFEIIRPYIVPCMEYKVDMEYEKQPYEGHII